MGISKPKKLANAVTADKVGARRRKGRVPASGAGAAIRCARAMLEPGAACVLDTETTDLDGAIVEVAVIDACTGDVLLDTLVNSGDVRISQEAFRVHGICDEDVADAPTWPDVLPTLLRVTWGRKILAYNAEFDLGRVQYECHRHERDPGHLGDHGNWGCVMNYRSERRLPLLGGHRALADTRTARDVLLGLTAPARRSVGLS
ncbi:MAG: 3'-5' exonuclease [Pseudonocardiaceae bacterium]